MSKRNKFILTLRKRQGLLIIITAALLLELLSAGHYYYTRHLMEKELEKQAESEMTNRTILIKSALNTSESILNNHLWDITDNLSHPDSVNLALSRMVQFNHNLMGAGVCFVPGYYPTESRLYELYASHHNQKDGKVVTRQIADEVRHDYTKRAFYQKAMAADGEAVWVEPYIDNEGAGGLVTSYAVAIRDHSRSIAGVAAIDLSLEWLRDTIDGRHLYPSSFVLLLTEDGEPIIRPSEQRIAPETTESILALLNDPAVPRQKSRSGQCTVIHFKTGKRNGTLFHTDMKGQPHWQVAEVFYNDEVYASLSQLRVFFLLLLLLAFGILFFMIARFARDEKKLQQQTLEQERLTGELRIANGIQQALLPAQEPTLASTSEVSVEGRLIPAKAVGGDLYNAFVQDGKLFFCIGDVSGKGIPASLIMAITQTLFRNIAAHESDPAHIMQLLNEAGCRNNTSSMFVTMFIGVLDIKTGLLRYCNAGHEKPVKVESGKWKVESEVLRAVPNLPIGLFDDFCYVTQETNMKPGSTLFLYTDGLTEARNAQQELFGREPVMRVIHDIGTTNPKVLVDAIITEVQQFSEGAEQSDDLTLLAIHYYPSGKDHFLDEELTLNNDLKEVATLNTFMDDVMARLKIDTPLASKLRLAVEEAVVNVMKYAYPAGTAGTVNIRVRSNGSWLKFILTDAGVPFDPTQKPVPDITLPAEQRPVGGLGILLIRKAMDTVSYEYTDGKNILTLIKKINHN